MIIENLECLRLWLVQTLTPICDADPETLAKYVIALVKKEKPHEELKDVCSRELEVFLQGKTKAFVTQLFDALQNKLYVPELEAKNNENCSKDKIPCSPLPPRDVSKNRQRDTDVDYRPACSLDRRGPTEPPLNQNISLSKRDHLAERDKMPNAFERQEESDFYKVSDLAGRSVFDVSRSPRADRNFHSASRTYPLERGRTDVFEHLDARNHRPRTSPVHRRGEVYLQRDHSHMPFKHYMQDGRYDNERQRQFPSLEKLSGANWYRSPAGSPRSDRAENRYHATHQPWRQHHEDLNHPDLDSERFGQPRHPLRSPFSHRQSRPRSRSGSHTPSRSVERAPLTTLSRSRSPSLTRSRSWSLSLTGRSSRSRSPTLDGDNENKPELVDEVIDSRSSTPLEEEEYKVSKPLLKVKYESARPLTLARPRCRDYDEKGFCVRGDLCDFDHGNDAVVVDGMKIPFPASRMPNHIGPPMPSLPPPQGGLPLMTQPLYVSRPYPEPLTTVPLPMPFPSMDGGATYLPPAPPPPPPPPPPPHLLPPMVQLCGIDTRLHSPGLPHLRAYPVIPPMMPPPFVAGRSLTLRPEPARGFGELYQPVMMPVEPYLPEPYSSKSPPFQTPPKSDEKWEAVADTDVVFGTQKLAPDQIIANRQTNLVRVHTDEEVPSSTDEKSESKVVLQRAGTKRSAAEAVDVTSDSASDSTKNSLHPSPPKKSAFEHPGVRHGGTNNTTLELRKLPKEQNTIANINNHFSKFGIIVNLQVGWDGDPQAALVSFASNAQAQLAYRSQEPFLNNRFIKIFWHNSEKSSQSQVSSAPVAETPRQRIIIPERHKLQLNNTLKNAAQAAKNTGSTTQQLAATANALPVKNTTADTAGVHPKMETLKMSPAAEFRPSASVAPITTNSAPQMQQVGSTKLQRQISREIITNKDVLAKKLELQKKSQELLTKQIEQQKILLEKLEKDKTTMTADERADIIETIKKLAKKIEELKAMVIKPDLVNKTIASVKATTTPTSSSSSSSVNNTDPGNRNKVNNSLNSSGKKISPVPVPHVASKTPVFANSQQAQRALLDTELDLMSRQKEGNDAAELLQRVTALKEEAASLGLLGPSTNLGSKSGPTRGQGNTSARGRGAGQTVKRWPGGFPGAAHTVDRRPKQLLVTGFLTEEKDSLILHLKEFGELDSCSSDLSVPSLSISFKSRQSAEKAATDGCNFNGKKLKMVWQKPSSVLTNNGSESADVSVEMTDRQLLKEDVRKTKPSGASFSPAEGVNESSAGQRCKSEGQVEKQSKPNIGVANMVHQISVEDDFDEEALIGIDEEDEDENNEGGRPWRR